MKNPITKFMTILLAWMLAGVAVAACDCKEVQPSQASKEKAVVDRQQSQYAKGQPIPTYAFSLERDLLIQLYNLRNQKVATHAVWRSDMGVVEGDCPSMGFGLPYDTSLTNPLKAEWHHSEGHQAVSDASAVVGQAEPNGIFASTNTSATWVMCTDETGAMMPIYVEAKVTVYPYAVTVDYATGRVVRAGQSKALTIKAGK